MERDWGSRVSGGGGGERGVIMRRNEKEGVSREDRKEGLKRGRGEGVSVWRR